MVIWFSGGDVYNAWLVGWLAGWLFVCRQCVRRLSRLAPHARMRGCPATHLLDERGAVRAHDDLGEMVDDELVHAVGAHRRGHNLGDALLSW